MRRFYFWPSLLLNMIVVSCTVGPKYEPPEAEVPEEWSSPLSNGMHHSSSECFVWWKSLNDKTLNQLLDLAAYQNLDLYIAGTRILEARLSYKGQQASLLPHVDASLNDGHVSYNKKALLDKVLGHHRKSNRRNFNFFEVGFDAEWEIDLFGLNAHEIEIAKFRLEQSEEDFNSVWVTLSAEIGKNYIQLRSLQSRKGLLDQVIEAQIDAVGLTNQLLTIGESSEIDFQQAQEQLYTLNAQRPTLQMGIDKAIHRLSILLGYPPGELFALLIEPQILPELPENKPIGLPSELLRRRPDIRKAERELAAANEEIGSATAALFPKFSLWGFVGELSSHLTSWFHPVSGVWYAGSQLAAPIFNSRNLTKDVEYSKLKERQALYEYQKTVLEALEETENGIAAFRYEEERYQSLLNVQGADQDTYNLTKQLYERGAKSFLDVIGAKRVLLSAQDTSLQSEETLLMHYISLYKALGGGWDFSNCEQISNQSKTL